MANNIVLSSGVRANLLSLQNTHDKMSITQNRLATGKRVNTAIDNPTNYFMSQALSDRANDLNALLDAINQSQKTLQAANQGITSLSNLVQQAKSIATQARQVAEPQTNYAQIDQTGGVDFSETIGSFVVGSAYAAPGAGNGGNITITTHGTTFTIAVADTATEQNVIDAINQATSGGKVLGDYITASDTGGKLKISANTSDDDFTINPNAVSATLGLTADAATARSVASLNLLDLSAGLAGKSLTVQANSGTAKTITFGNASDQVSTFAELQAALAGTNVSATLTANGSAKNLTLSVAARSGNPNSLVLSGNALGAGAGTIGIAAGTSAGTPSSPTPDSTRANYQQQYNEILAQIDAMTKDSVYNGINLLAGDQLKVVFNERGTSSLTIQGVHFDAAGLGLTPVTGNAFQANVNIDATLDTVTQALTLLRNQATNFGSTTNTVEIRQDFIKSLNNILKDGSDQLVISDSNEEGANMLALQTRQQLSTTALSLSSQADQAVLRLFG